MASGNGSIASSQYAKAISNKPSPILVSKKVRYGDAPVTVRENQKMGWFRKKFYSWVRRAWEESHNDLYPTGTVNLHEGLNGKTSVRFTIYPASGGYVIEHAKYNRYQDGEGPELTIINTGDDLGKAVEHILTMEALKS